jgi:uncharacterized protein (TIGR00255 family)
MIHSMTGFAAHKGAFGPWNWVWDIRAVNARGLDLRLKLPDWIDGLEQPARKAVAAAVTRGNVSLGLRVSRDADAGGLSLDTGALERTLSMLVEITHAAEARGLVLARPSAADIAAMRGVLDSTQQDEDTAPLARALLDDLPPLLAAFNEMRAHEGAALGAILTEQLAQVEALVAEATGAAEARREAQGEALRTALARVMDNTDGADEARVAQELAMIAVKSDIREEIDRLGAHVTQARSMLAGSEARGRKLDFLMQEFNREANTLCSKSQHQELTRIGLELKAVIDQMREQVQNVE